MTNDANKKFETTLRDGLRKLNPDQAQAIRQAFYKAAEGLQSLADLLERSADSAGDSSDAFIAIHLLACEGIEAMNETRLGQIL